MKYHLTKHENCENLIYDNPPFFHYNDLDFSLRKFNWKPILHSFKLNYYQNCNFVSIV